MQTLEENITAQQDWWFLLEEETEELLRSYVNCGVFENFHFIRSSLADKVEVAVTIFISNRGYIYNIFSGPKRDDQHIHSKEKMNGYDFIVNSETTAEELCLEILDTINDRLSQLEIELDYVDKINSTPFNTKYFAKIAEQSEDYAGYDVEIFGELGSMPHQLKSGYGGLKEHKKKYPHIPAQSYEITSDIRKVLKDLDTIYTAYHKGEILHINTMFETPL